MDNVRLASLPRDMLMAMWLKYVGLTKMMHDDSYHSFVFSPCGFGKLIIIIVLPSHTENIMYTILYNSLDVSF